MNDRAKFEAVLGNLTPVSAAQCEQCWVHYQTLLRWNRKINLTRITDAEEAARRHYAESILLARQLPDNALRIADLGSGAGFPGFCVALVRPEAKVILIESDQRKAAFLRESTGDLGNLLVRCVRGSEFSESVDWVVSRAVKATDVAELARRVARGLTVLVAAADVESVKLAIASVHSAAVPLPWDASSVCLSLDVPRGTS